MVNIRSGGAMREITLFFSRLHEYFTNHSLVKCIHCLPPWKFDMIRVLIDCGDGDRLDGCVDLKCDKGYIDLVIVGMDLRCFNEAVDVVYCCCGLERVCFFIISVGLDSLSLTGSTRNEQGIKTDLEGSGEVDINSILTSFTDKMTNMEATIMGSNADGQEPSNADESPPKVNFRTLEINGSTADDFELKIPKSSVMKVTGRLNNSIYGYFIGKFVAFPVVENYVFNAWGKLGIQKIMMNSKGFYFFKFSSKNGIEDVKMHDIPVAAFTANGLSAIATKIGTPIMLDSYTSDMCSESWGKSSYARAMVEVHVDKEMKTSMVIAIPNLEDEGYTRETVTFEYEWLPLSCPNCQIFGHTNASCPFTDKVNTKKNEEIINDGFQMVKGHNNARKQNDKTMGFKTKSSFVYRPVVNHGGASTSKKQTFEGNRTLNVDLKVASASKNNAEKGKASVHTSNSFSALDEYDENGKPIVNVDDDVDSDGDLIENNIRGLNRISKQKEVHQVILENHLNVCAVLESHLDVSKLERVCAKVCSKWSWTSNGSLCTKGSRIILGWNTNYVDVTVLSCTRQAMHTRIILKGDQKSMFCTFIYADNKHTKRKELWKDLELHSTFVRSKSWVIMGDFNSARFLEDTYCGSSKINISMREFNECVIKIEMADVNCTGLHFTWTQKPKANDGMLKKIDRVLSNTKFTSEFPEKPKPFKFANLLVYKSDFKRVVAKEWATGINGHNMFKVIKRLRLLKKPFRNLLSNQGNLHERVLRLRHELDTVQKALDSDPSSQLLREEEALYLTAFNQAVIDEERFLMQKSKAKWLRVGDSNSVYFHRMVKARISRSRIDYVVGLNNISYEGKAIPKAFVEHYMGFLGIQEDCTPLNMEGLFSKTIDPTKAILMAREFTGEEVHKSIFSIGDSKSPGPNEINHTILALLPKVPTPTRINDYRLISCCNVIYKVISKLITNRIKEGLQDIVSDNQLAFVPGRSISDNILITQELMHNYHLNKGPPRCAFKIDIQKSYDTVDWKFLRDILGGFGFHPTMVGWIMTCVTSTSFSLCVNGDLHGYFKGRRGLRQASVKVIMEALEEFKGVSGLVPSIPKSTTFFCNVVSHVKASILHLMPFDEGTLPIKYLGVPLISSRLRYRDCKVLVERVQNRINDWKNKYLSFAGRLQLVMSVLSSMHGYWASVFILPATIIHETEQLMCGFLWCQGEMKRGKAKIVAPVLIHDRQDKVCWRTQDGNLKSFSVVLAWESIRARRDNVPWFHVVWFSACIPCHAFHLWLAMGRKLKTQDKLKQWDVWLRITNLEDMPSTLPIWDDIVDWLLPISKGVVRLKLATLHFKANAQVDKMMAVWKIANTCTNGG
ncbi:uncharacterized protein Tco_1338593 [Tanacetum coccineum]